MPNYESKDARIYKEYWAAYDVPRHLYHFSKNSLELLTKKHQMKIKKILPMPFDSFYVSLMSEKYKCNKSSLNSFKNAIVNGIISNKEKNNNSSILYIVGHQ